MKTKNSAPAKASALDHELAVLLADYQILYMKLRGYHWTVSGPLFFALHAKFEELYQDAAEKVDALAERLAARGVRPPVTLQKQLALARLEEETGEPSPNDMVSNIAADLGAINAALRALQETAEKNGDQATHNLAQDYADEQEKTLWMLRAFLTA